jgi:hypothetical protein
LIITKWNGNGGAAGAAITSPCPEATAVAAAAGELRVEGAMRGFAVPKTAAAHEHGPRGG